MYCTFKNPVAYTYIHIKCIELLILSHDLFQPDHLTGNAELEEKRQLVIKSNFSTSVSIWSIYSDLNLS